MDPFMASCHISGIFWLKLCKNLSGGPASIRLLAEAIAGQVVDLFFLGGGDVHQLPQCIDQCWWYDGVSQCLLTPPLILPLYE